jgi:hypothetical protein
MFDLLPTSATLQSQPPGPSKAFYTMYMAPAVVRNHNKDAARLKPFAEICDLWSAAVTLYYLLYQTWPFLREEISSWRDEKNVPDVGKVEFKTGAR